MQHDNRLRYAIITALISGTFCLSLNVHADCSSPPVGSGGDWFRSYQQWCSACGGTPSTNASPATCTPGSNWGGSSGSTSSGFTPSEQMALEAAGQVGAMIGGAIHQSLFGNPQTDAANARAAEEARIRAEQERQAYEAEQEARKQRLLGELQDVDKSPELTLIDDENPSGNLPLMLDNASASSSNSNSAFMKGNKNKSATYKPGGAILKQPNPSSQKSVNQQKTNARTIAAVQPSTTPTNAAQDDSAFNKGYVDGSQCFSASAGNHCSSAQGDTLQQCIRSYETGYRQGESIKRVLLAQAHNAGVLDKQQSRKNSGFTNPSAEGPCRTQWIESYNAGYAGAPVTTVGK